MCCWWVGGEKPGLGVDKRPIERCLGREVVSRSDFARFVPAILVSGFERFGVQEPRHDVGDAIEGGVAEKFW